VGYRPLRPDRQTRRRQLEKTYRSSFYTKIGPATAKICLENCSNITVSVTGKQKRCHMEPINLSKYEITVSNILRNLNPAKLYEEAIRYEPNTTISSAGALIAYSGAKTGRSPKDKRVVKHPNSEKNIWWGPVNFPMEEQYHRGSYIPQRNFAAHL
jgi:hypothetical protein